jgi:hypothetical protein
VCFAFSLTAHAAPQVLPSPTPDGCYPGFTTAEGCKALHSLTSGAGNTGIGWYSLFGDSTASYNTGLGAGTLPINNADSNTATGAAALLLNTDGTQNCAYGTDALVYNSHVTLPSGADYNDAFGAFALFSNTDGYTNNAFGNHALFENIHGAGNTAVGDLALQNNDSSGMALGNINSAVGAQALQFNNDGDSNNAVGYSALQHNTDGLENNAMGAFALGSNDHGASNVAIGDSALTALAGAHSFNTVVGWNAGIDLTTGDDNIYIGATSAAGQTSESSTIRIGDPGFVSACWIAGIAGQTATGGVPVVITAGGKLGTVPAGSPLSETEQLKQRHIVQELKATTEKQAAVIALQQTQIKELTASLKQQSEQIQRVSAQLEVIRPTPQVVENR